MVSVAAWHTKSTLSRCNEEEMEKTLSEIGVGQTGVVVGFATGSGAYRQKLLAMGLLKGTPFRVVRVAPMGDPLEITVRDFNLSLRRDEARFLLVEEVQR